MKCIFHLFQKYSKYVSKNKFLQVNLKLYGKFKNKANKTESIN